MTDWLADPDETNIISSIYILFIEYFKRADFTRQYYPVQYCPIPDNYIAGKENDRKPIYQCV